MEHAFGIDLSGPANIGDSVLVHLQFDRESGAAAAAGVVRDATDRRIREAIRNVDGASVVGLDAPLSYQPGGGFRDGDRALRERLHSEGFARNSVLPPTAPRMIYLTARGMTIARMVRDSNTRVVETHPASVLLLRSADEDDVERIDERQGARDRMVEELASCDVSGTDEFRVDSDHVVCALAAAVAARDAARGVARWRHPADPPHHPFPIAC